MNFAAQLQAIRLDRHHTVAEAAVIFGVSPRTCEGWEQGRITKVWMHRPLLEFFERHAPKKKAPKGPQPGRPPKRKP